MNKNVMMINWDKVAMKIFQQTQLVRSGAYLKQVMKGKLQSKPTERLVIEILGTNDLDGDLDHIDEEFLAMDYEKLTEKINKQTGQKYSKAYVQTCHSERSTSGNLSPVIKEILEDVKE